MKNNAHKMMQGAVVLSVAALIAKILSATYRIPLENLVGNEGFYVYQQIYPIYGIGMTFALSGFPIFISKIIAEQDSPLEKMTLARQLFVILMGFGIGIFVSLQLAASGIATLMGDKQLAPLIQSVAWMFLLMPFLSVSRGYYQGNLQMAPTAISQVLEQIVRVFVIIVVALMSVKYHWSVYKMGTLAMASSFLGGLGAAIYLSGFFIRLIKQKKQASFKYNTLVKRLLTEGIMICFFTSLMILMQLIDSFTIKNGLQAYGLTETVAKNLKGTYDRAQPLVQLGLVIGVSFASSLLPSLTQALEQNNVLDFKQKAQMVMKTSLGIGSAATIGMVALMPQINHLLFGSRALSNVIAIYVVSVIFMTMINTYSSLLQSLKEFKVLLKALLVGLLSKYCLNLLGLRSIGIIAASEATVLSLFLAVIYLMKYSSIEVKELFGKDGFLMKLSISCGLMFVVTKLLALILEMILNTGRLQSGVVLLLSVPVGALVFAYCTLKWHIFTAEEIYNMPGGKKIIKIINKL